MIIAVRDAGMPRKDFIASFPKNETNSRWLARHIKGGKKYSAPLARFKERSSGGRGSSSSSKAAITSRSTTSRKSTRRVDRRSQGAPRQEGNGRGQSAPGHFHRQEVHQRGLQFLDLIQEATSA